MGAWEGEADGKYFNPFTPPRVESTTFALRDYPLTKVMGQTIYNALKNQIWGFWGRDGFPLVKVGSILYGRISDRGSIHSVI